MNKEIEAPELFNNRNAVPGGKFKAVAIEVSPEGIYSGNGQFKDPGDTNFRVVGFDRRQERSPWIGRAYVKAI